MSVDMLQRKRSTTIPAVLNNRSLGTLVAGTDSSLAATAASNGHRSPHSFQNWTGSSLRDSVIGSMAYEQSSRSTAATSTVAGADGPLSVALFFILDVMKFITMLSPRARLAGGGAVLPASSDGALVALATLSARLTAWSFTAAHAVL